VGSLRIRVSPHGDRVANCDGGGITVYDRAGQKTSVKTPPNVYGHAWTPDDTLWFAAGETWRWKSVWWGKPTGRPRQVYRPIGSVLLQDASSDGRLLVHHGAERAGVRARAPGGEGERELGVFSWSWAVDLSADGSRALICEGDSPGRPAALTYVRPTGGGPTVRLGEGTPLALSPTGTLALVASPEAHPRYIVTPTGPGESRTLPSERFERIEAAWFLDEGRLLVDASSSGQRSRGLLIDLSGGEPRVVTPEGIVSIRGSYSERSVIGVAADGTLARYPLQGGDPQPMPARLPSGTVALRVSGDGRFVFVGRVGMPYRIDRLELATGRLTPWKALRPDDLTGATHIVGVALTTDGEAYAYTYGRYFQDLYLVEGLRP
jgi:hypothetical protein